jgi:PKD repeat protein
MRKIAIILITLIMISVGFFSGCTNLQQSKTVQNKNPAASCSGNPTNGTAPLTVYFVGSGNDPDGTITSYHWDFGDGSISDLQNPSHTFTNEGTYTVIITVTDNNASTGTNIMQIHVTKPTNQPPIASLSANRTGGTMPLVVSFTGSSNDTNGYITSYFWNFGDGSSSNQQSPSHTFTKAGTYNVTLTVTDNNGTTDTCSKTIKCYPVVSHLTLNGLNYLCQKYGGSTQCVVSQGLVVDYTDTKGVSYTGMTAGTADIVGFLILGVVASIHVTTPIGRSTITSPYQALVTANGGVVLDFNDVTLLTQHDEKSGTQWCYTTLTQNGLNYICQNFGDSHQCVVSNGLQWSYLDVEGQTHTETGATSSVVSRLIFTQLVVSITMLNPARGTFTYQQLRTTNGGWDITLPDCRQIDTHDENSGNQWCYSS